MAMVTAKGIPTGSPVTDASAVWTPPHVGPLDGAHMWLAHTLRGTVTPGTGAVTRLPDMIGTLDLTGIGTSSNSSFTDDTLLPFVSFRDGYPKVASTAIPAAENTDNRTVVTVVRPHATPRTRQLVIPGWGDVHLNGAKVTVGSFSAAINPEAWTILSLKYAAGGTCDVWINGTKAGQATGLTKSTTALVWQMGGYQATAFTEDYALVKVWNRGLTDAEITDAVTDTKRLTGIA